MTSAGLEPVYEGDVPPPLPLPERLVERYGGTFGLDAPCLVANFVASLDGVVAIPALPRSNRLISDSSQDDRFVMGLLRACADAVVVGAGTLAASPNSLWTPEQAYPDEDAAYAELRERLGLDGDAPPELVVLSASGVLDPRHPALAAGAVLVLTSDLGAERLAGALPPQASIRSLGAHETLDPHAIVAALAERGHRIVLSEGGPHTIGPLLEAGLVDELFFTLSPLLVGRSPAADARLALVEGTDLLTPDGPPHARLIGIRRGGDHLFLRYALGRR